MEQNRINERWNDLFDYGETPEITGVYRKEAEYHNTISAFGLSHHGFVIGIGFTSGDIIACDSRNFCNEHVYTSHNVDVTAISFSRDTLHIASGDKAGFFQIHNVLTGILEYSETFPSPINSIVSNDYNPDNFLILLSDCSLCIFNLSTKVSIPTKYQFSCIVWGNNQHNFYGAYRKKVKSCTFDDQYNIDEKESENYPADIKIKDIVSLTISHNKDMILAIDSNGKGNLLLAETSPPCFIFTDSDVVNRTKYAFGAFSCDDNYVLMGTKTVSSMTFAAFKKNDHTQTSPDYTLKGLKEQVRGIIAHPLYPILFIRLKYQIFKWDYYHREPLYNSVPAKDLMTINTEYTERETEFDSSDDDNVEDDTPRKYEPLKLRSREPEGVLNIFPDDVNFPQQIYFLPFRHEKPTKDPFLILSSI